MATWMNRGWKSRNAWVFGVILSAPAWAETEGDSPAQGAGQLEEITVTAQRRSENLQSVPLSVTAFSANNLIAAGVTDVRDIQ